MSFLSRVCSYGHELRQIYCNGLDLYYGFNGGFMAMTWELVLCHPKSLMCGVQWCTWPRILNVFNYLKSRCVLYGTSSLCLITSVSFV